MEYELCKELKDKGFPQIFTAGSIYFKEDGKLLVPITTDGSIMMKTQSGTKVPTLNELVQNCGDIVLYVNEHTPCVAYGSGECGDGKTPEIAVANLWLAINK